jgi:hypothetical protein
MKTWPAIALALACACMPAALRAQSRADAYNDDDDGPAGPVQVHGRAATAEEIAAALQRYAREPTVEQVVSAALRVAPPERAEALASRARSAGWVPRIGLRARRGQAIDLSSADSAADALRLKSNDDLTLEANLFFELDRVVFRREEVALARQERAEHQDRGAIVHDVILLYFERRRLQLERDLSGEVTPAREIRIAEIEALLDAFTNGEFRRMISINRWTTGASTPATTSQSPPKSKPPEARSPEKHATSPKAESR